MSTSEQIDERQGVNILLAVFAEDVAEVEKFRSFLRRAAEEPRGSGRTWGDLYDEMYAHETSE